MNSVVFTVTLALQGPVFSAAQGGRAFGLHSAILRDWHGQPALSGALIRGNLRHAWQDLNTYGLQVDIDRWLGGKGYFDATDDNGLTSDSPRSTLRFSHWFTAQAKGQAEGRRTRIKIGDTGSVAEQMLQFIETPFDAGDVVEFCGDIKATLNDGESAAQLAEFLRKGLSWVPAFGGFKGVGFGRLLSVKVACQPIVPQPVLAVQGDRFGISLQFDDPICFAKPQTGKTHNNLFESEGHIPGAAILAVLAKEWPTELRDAFNQIVISHALPATEKAQRPVPTPYSLAHAGRLYDLSGTVPQLIDGVAPSFQLDWKDDVSSEATQYYPKPKIQRLLETRTAIDSTRRVAATSELFAMDLIDTRQQTWLANIDLTAVPAKLRGATRQALLQRLAQGLAPLGKTDAYAQVSVTPPHLLSIPQVPAVSTGETEVTLTLITDAHLLDAIPKATEIQRPEHWRAAYSQVIETLSEGSLTVKQLFTREKLVGGQFLQHRFNRNNPYRARLLTAAGSVLVLDLVQPQPAKDFLAQWLQTGLPAISDTNWRTNPYLPQNGYGEVAILQRIEELSL